jgi:hypothetical protein
LSLLARLVRIAVVCAAIGPAPAAALEVRIKEVAAAGPAVHAALELSDVIPDRFKKTLDDAGVLHLRVQAELWESRPVWDRLVYPAMVRILRLTKETPVGRQPMPLGIDLGATSRIAAPGRYYVHVVATIGTLAEREADEVGDAVFGRQSETNSLGSLGRLVVRTALEINDYLQSVSADAKSRKISGSDLLRQRP